MFPLSPAPKAKLYFKSNMLPVAADAVHEVDEESAVPVVT